MPDIPTKDTVFGTREIPRSRRQVQGYNAGQAERAGIAAAEGLSRQVSAQEQAGIRAGQVIIDAGERFGQVAKDIDRMQEQRNQEMQKLELAKAQSYVLEQTSNLETTLLQDPDYTTAQTKWTEGMNKIHSEAIKMVPPEKRELFNYALRDINTKGIAQMKRHAYDMQGKALAASVENTVTVQSNVMSKKLAAGDQSGAFASLSAAEAEFRAAQRAGAYSSTTDNGESRWIAIKQGMVSDALQSVPPKQQLEMLARKPEKYSPPEPGAPLSVRNNNPGNIRGKDDNFRVFDTREDGIAAMEQDLSAKISGNSAAMKEKFGDNYTPTITTVISTWAPPEENDTAAYIATVSRDTGIPPGRPLTEDDIKKIMPSMIKVEGGSEAANTFATPDGTSGLAALLPESDRAKIRNSAIDALQAEDPVTILRELNAGAYNGVLTQDEIRNQKTNAASAIKKINEQADFDRNMKYLSTNASAMKKFSDGSLTYPELNKLVEMQDMDPEFANEMKRSLIDPEPMKENPNPAALSDFYSRKEALLIKPKSGGPVSVAADLLADAARLQIDILKSRDLSPEEKQTVMKSVQLGMVKTMMAGKNGAGVLPEDHYGKAIKQFKESGVNIAEVNKMFREYVAQADAQGLDVGVDQGAIYDPVHYFFNTKGENERDQKAAGIVKGILARNAGEKYEGLTLLPEVPNAAIGKDGSSTVISNGAPQGRPDKSIIAPFTLMKDPETNKVYRKYKDGTYEEVK